jgi:hypothetical protein
MVNEGTPEIVSTKQREFLEDVFLSNTVSAALVIRKGRRVFKDAPTPLESAEREEFRDALKSELLKLAKRYSSAVEEKVHIDNIRGLAKDLSDAYGKLLDGDLLFGRAQKALNLYLKYLWCEGLIVCPPHCPFDNDVISTLRKLLQGTWGRLGHYEPSDPTFRQKLFFWRQGFDALADPHAKLTVTGRRIDSPAPPLLSETGTGRSLDGSESFYVAGVNFPTTGCWEITGHYENDEVTFVVWIPE